jgi:hypothetical protein
MAVVEAKLVLDVRNGRRNTYSPYAGLKEQTILSRVLPAHRKNARMLQNAERSILATVSAPSVPSAGPFPSSTATESTRVSVQVFAELWGPRVGPALDYWPIVSALAFRPAKSLPSELPSDRIFKSMHRSTYALPEDLKHLSKY